VKAERSTANRNEDGIENQRGVQPTEMRIRYGLGKHRGVQPSTTDRNENGIGIRKA